VARFNDLCVPHPVLRIDSIESCKFRFHRIVVLSGNLNPLEVITRQVCECVTRRKLVVFERWAEL
jgi:hypothetical protein